MKNSYNILVTSAFKDNITHSTIIPNQNIYRDFINMSIEILYRMTAYFKSQMNNSYNILTTLAFEENISI